MNELETSRNEISRIDAEMAKLFDLEPGYMYTR